MQNKTITIGETEIHPGTVQRIRLPSVSLYTQTEVELPAFVFHGKKAGPKLFITGTIHGDELDSIEILRRLHLSKALKHIHGTLITVPIVNVSGLILLSRYLPDRRDLNRAFPGSKTGSLAARLANILIEEIVNICNYGIDLHTGAVGRINMPQIRINLDTPGAEDFARLFGVPIILNAKLRDGSLRQSASELGIPLLVYEGGEALRFNEICIRAGVQGILNVLSGLGMIKKKKVSGKRKHVPIVTETSRWVRAPTSGLVQNMQQVSHEVKEGDLLAYIHDPFLSNPSVEVLAPFHGIIIGQTKLPLLSAGDAMFHIASIGENKDIAQYIDDLREELTSGDATHPIIHPPPHAGE